MKPVTLYACMWPDGQLLEEVEGEPAVFTAETAADKCAHSYRDYDGTRSLKVVRAEVEFRGDKK